MDKGYPSNTPVAIIEKGSWGKENGERVTRGTLRNIVDLAIKENVSSPAILICGDVVNVLQNPESRESLKLAADFELGSMASMSSLDITKTPATKKERVSWV